MTPPGHSCHREHCRQNASGFSYTTLRISSSPWPRRLHLQHQFRHGQRVGLAPVAGRVGHDPLGADHLDDVAGPRRRAFRRRVERHAAPEAAVQGQADGVLLDVIDADAVRLDAAVVLEHVDDHPCPLVLVLQVRRVDEDQFVGADGQIDVFLEDGGLVARVLVEADFADAEDVGLVEEFGDEGDHFARQGDVFGLLGVDAEPAVVADAEQGGAFRLDFGEVAEVVAEALGGAAVEPGPEGRLADRRAAAQGHAVVVVGGPRDHVDVGVEPFCHCLNSLLVIELQNKTIRSLDGVCLSPLTHIIADRRSISTTNSTHRRDYRYRNCSHRAWQRTPAASCYAQQGEKGQPRCFNSVIAAAKGSRAVRRKRLGMPLEVASCRHRHPELTPLGAVGHDHEFHEGPDVWGSQRAPLRFIRTFTRCLIVPSTRPLPIA